MIVLHFDGLAEPNPGVGTWGFVAWRDGKKVYEGYGLVGTNVTNNVSEYTAVVKGIEWLLKQGWTDEAVVVRGDSQLVIGQVDQGWKVKAAKLAPFVARLKADRFKFKDLRFEHIPRERNRDADALTNLAYQLYRNGDLR